MFEAFVANFRLLPADQDAGPPWRDPRLLAADAYLELAGRFAGCTFENGLYRLHDATSGPLSAGLIAQALPDFAKRACPFAFDWLGRQFALDAERVQDGESLVLMLEPGTGQALEIPWSFRAFHDQLVELRQPALAADFHSEWAAANSELGPIALRQCVGYRVPLFLGGEDSIGNLEVIDLDVYWSLCGQLRHGTKQLPPGTSIHQIAGGWAGTTDPIPSPSHDDIASGCIGSSGRREGQGQDGLETGTPLQPSPPARVDRMGRRFDPKHWPETARTRWRSWRTRRAVIPLGPGIVTDQAGTERTDPRVIGYRDVPRGRRTHRAKTPPNSGQEL